MAGKFFFLASVSFPPLFVLGLGEVWNSHEESRAQEEANEARPHLEKSA